MSTMYRCARFLTTIQMLINKQLQEYYLDGILQAARSHRSHEQRLLWLYAEWAGSSRRCVWEHMKLSRRRDLGEPCSAPYRRRCHREEPSGGGIREITPNTPNLRRTCMADDGAPV